jgi:pilus assembly protein CpaE
LEIDPESVSLVLDKIRRTGPHIILDLPHLWNGWMNQTLASADDIVIVASPDLSSLRNARHLVEFAVKSRPHDAPPFVVLNMVGVPKRPEIALKDFAEHVGAAVVAEIPFDPAAFGAAMNNGRILMEASGESKTAQAISALAARLTGREPQAPKKTRLLDKIGLTRR